MKSKADPLDTGYTRDCLECGQSFRATRSFVVLCSDTCRRRRAAAQVQRWYREHQKEMRGYHHRYHIKHKARQNAKNIRNYYKRRARGHAGGEHADTE